jgi:NADH:ubiquinone oxidoreductase subunit F (NADH-binding)
MVAVNGMEGEPASDKDKVLLTRAPHLVLDGAQLMAAMCGAKRVIVCVPVGRDGVAAAVTHAIAEREVHRAAPVQELVVRPPDRFVAGEESALAQWISSGRSLPLFRTDKGVPLRIGGAPILVHNTETLAHVALIARQGSESFRSHGMTEEPGTTLVTVTGAVSHPGVVEVDRGTALHEIVARSEPLGQITAMLVGGYGGAWVGSQHFATPYASIPLRTVGATAGVGIIVVLGAGACGVTESARIARYLAEQSSGQCGPCVFGLPAIADDLSQLARGLADANLRQRLWRRLEEINGRGACRHPDGAVSMVRSALSVFASDVDAHAKGEPCAHWTASTQFRFPHSTCDGKS